jgi:ketosteroid isomerase-like protein
MDSEEIVVIKGFVKAINKQDLAKMESLMTADHTYVDVDGTEASGKRDMVDGWRTFFQSFPDFHISIDHILQKESLLALFGRWTGTFAGKEGCQHGCEAGAPAAWRAEIAEGKVKVWQLYTDHTKTNTIIEAYAE